MVNVVYFARNYISPQSEQIGPVGSQINQSVTIIFIRVIMVAASQIRHVSRIHFLDHIGDLRCVPDVVE